MPEKKINWTDIATLGVVAVFLVWAVWEALHGGG